MKNNLIKAIFVVLYIFILITAYNTNISYAEKNGFSGDSKYIWIDEENSSNSWVCFRKKFEIKEKNKDSYKARIAVDSKYWLYINGKIVIREGGLKRSKKNSIYYDEIELKDYLIEGENTIGILVWHFGKVSFSHIDSSLGSLLFYMDIGEKEIVSDNTWKAKKNTAYLQDEKEVPPRLSESNIYYDANLEINNWYENSFDDTNWENAKILGNPNDLPWGKLIKRDIPFFKFDKDIIEYENFSEYKDVELAENKLIKMQLPSNTQFMPYFKIEAPKGKIIKISCQNDDVKDAHETTYITKDGVQEFESLAWINGDNIYYNIPAGIKIVSLGYRKTEYDSNELNSFKCDNEFFNSLWEMSVDTLKVNMRDSYMDCPDRERTMWIADTSIAMEEGVYSLDENSILLYKKAIKDYISWQDGKVLMSVIPSYVANLQLPIQNLIGIEGIYNYYIYTGDKEFLEYTYPHFKRYLEIWNIKKDGTILGKKDYYKNLWKWYDTVGNTDDVLLENVWYYYANKKMYEISVILNKTRDSKYFSNVLKKLEKGINDNFYVKGKGYKSRNFEGFDKRANSIIILADIADEQDYGAISDILINEGDENTPFWEKYILEALYKMNMSEKAEKRIMQKYGEMVNKKEDYSSTLWEYFEKGKGSKNHAWSGCPIIIIQKYIAGIKPLEPGFKKIKIEPNFGSLNTVETSLNTSYGKVELRIQRNDDNYEFTVNSPVEVDY